MSSGVSLNVDRPWRIAHPPPRRAQRAPVRHACAGARQHDPFALHWHGMRPERDGRRVSACLSLHLAADRLRDSLTWPVRVIIAGSQLYGGDRARVLRALPVLCLLLGGFVFLNRI